MRIQGFDLAVDLPDGWYGRLYTNTDGPDAARSGILQLATTPIVSTDDDVGTATSQLIGSSGAMLMVYESPHLPWLDAQYEQAGNGPLALRPADAQPGGMEGMNPHLQSFVRRIVVKGRYFQVRALFGSAPDFARLGAVNALLGAVDVAAI